MSRRAGAGFRTGWLAIHLVVVGADTDGLDGLARGVGAALRVGGLLVLDDAGGRADERTVLLVAGGLLEHTLRLGGDTSRDVGRAGTIGAVGTESKV